MVKIEQQIFNFKQKESLEKMEDMHRCLLLATLLLLASQFFSPTVLSTYTADLEQTTWVSSLTSNLWLDETKAVISKRPEGK